MNKIKILGLILVAIFSLGACSSHVSHDADINYHRSAEDDNFIVKTYINKLDFAEDEEIIMYSTIEYKGNKDKVTIWSGEPFFNYKIYDGKDYYSRGITLDVLKTTILNKGEIYTIPFSKSGGFCESDPDAEYWRNYYSQKELKLPKGEYMFLAYTQFSLDQEQREKVTLEIEFEVKVK